MYKNSWKRGWGWGKRWRSHQALHARQAGYSASPKTKHPMALGSAKDRHPNCRCNAGHGARRKASTIVGNPSTTTTTAPGKSCTGRGASHCQHPSEAAAHAMSPKIAGHGLRRPGRLPHQSGESAPGQVHHEHMREEAGPRLATSIAGIETYIRPRHSLSTLRHKRILCR